MQIWFRFALLNRLIFKISLISNNVQNVRKRFCNLKLTPRKNARFKNFLTVKVDKAIANDPLKYNYLAPLLRDATNFEIGYHVKKVTLFSIPQRKTNYNYNWLWLGERMR